jgi:protoporphyrinogen oxidase
MTAMNREKRVLIIGAGPTGLGAATRLMELGHGNWEIVEASDTVGGLARSITDERGFIWDIGVHVNFSHYQHYDDLMLGLKNFEWLQGLRQSWVWTKDRFVPFAFQNNVRHLPKEAMWECIRGLIDVRTSWPNGREPQNFRQWIDWMFGPGIAKHFMLPYNEKIWACPPEEMNAHWVGDRVTPISLERVVENVIHERDDLGWGPNSTFRFPKFGGTGSVWKSVAGELPADKITFGTKLVKVDTQRRVAHFDDGSQRDYDLLLTAIPLDLFMGLTDMEEEKPAREGLRHSSLHMVGVGLRKPITESLAGGMSWIYFPDDNCPYYRATVFSNLSPHVVPDPDNQWSIMTETSESLHRPVNSETIVDEVIQGLINTRLIHSEDQVIDRFHIRVEHSYPTPSLSRDDALGVLLPSLLARGIYSRGRFGAWKYEIANQDHSLMQGVEAVDHMLMGRDEVTVWNPNMVNAPRRWLQAVKR